MHQNALLFDAKQKLIQATLVPNMTQTTTKVRVVLSWFFCDFVYLFDSQDVIKEVQNSRIFKEKTLRSEYRKHAEAFVK